MPAQSSGLVPNGQDFVNRDAQQGGAYPAGTAIYRAILTQAGTATPTAAVLVNTFGETLTIARSNTGIYTFTLAGTGTLFTAGVTWVEAGGQSGTAIDTKIVRTSSTVVTLSTFAADGSTATDLGGTISVEIAVYPAA